MFGNDTQRHAKKGTQQKAVHHLALSRLNNICLDESILT